MAKHIPKDFIDQVNARTNLVSLIDGRVPLKKAGSNYKACCPFHDEKTPSFMVSESEQFYHCFGCGAAGDAIRFLMDFDNLTFQESIESLAQLHGLTVPYEEKGQVANEEVRQIHEQGLACLADAAAFYHAQFYDKHGLPAREYLRTRELKKTTVDTFQLGYAPYGNLLLETLKDKYPLSILQAVGLVGEKEGRYYDWFRHRIVFPIFNPKGQVIAFGARAFGDEQPKYLNSPESEWFNKRHELYGLYQALQSKQRGKVLLVTEGYMDVIKLWQNGVDNAVAALGTAIGETHIAQLKKRAKKVYFSFDGDSAGRKAAEKALEAVFKQYDEAHQWRFMFMPQGQDPDSLIQNAGIEHFLSVKDSALRPSDFLIRLLEESFGDSRSVEADAQLIRQASTWLAYLSGNALGDASSNASSNGSGMAYQQLLKKALIEYFNLPELSLKSASAANKRRDSSTRYRQIMGAQTKDSQTVEEKLMACLFNYPSLALAQYPWMYEAKVFDELPLFWQFCYHLQCTGDNTEQAQAFVDKFGLHDKLKELSAYYQMVEEQDCENEFKDILAKLSARAVEKKQRLEKLGG